MNVEVKEITKSYKKNLLFKNINFRVIKNQPLAIIGPNGSGKSTLMQIMAKIQPPTKGSVTFFSDGAPIKEDKIHDHMGFVSPLINPYEELSALENISFIKKTNINTETIRELLEFYDLYRHRNKLIKHFSTGMKQRLKLICAFCNNPEILMLDEPSSNLDESGKTKLLSYLNSIQRNKIIIIATNDKKETAFCDEVIELGK